MPHSVTTSAASDYAKVYADKYAEHMERGDGDAVSKVMAKMFAGYWRDGIEKGQQAETE